jgi:D-alanyl-D-alanine carboxypeptidase (penicillin-binding protein 5/6)
MKKQTTYRYGKAAKRVRSRRRGLRFGLIIVVVVAIYVAYACLRPITYLPKLVIEQPKSSVSDMIWPSTGQFAVGIEGQGAVAVAPNEHVAPMASVTKLVTALAVLEKHPLKPGDQGETIRFTDADAAIYQSVIARDGVGIGVQPGQSMTERQALEAMLLASANNIAISLSGWAFGSEKEYATYANSMVQRLGLMHTHITGASGLDADTTSTPSDLVRLAELSVHSPVILAITALPQTDIPEFGTVYNISHISALDSAIHPLKVGLTDEAGACFVFWTQPRGSSERVFGAIMGQSDFKMLKAYVNTFAQKTIAQNYAEVTIAHKGDPVAAYIDASGTPVTAHVKEDVRIAYWRGQPVLLLMPASRSALRLEVHVGDAVKKYVLESNKPPGFAVSWRLLHPLDL